MPQSLKVESLESEKPIIFVFGEGLLIEALIHKFIPFLKVTVLGRKKILNGDIYFLPLTASSSILKLKEKISYAVISIETTKDLQALKTIFKKLKDDNSKILVILTHKNLSLLINTINELRQIKNLSFEIIGETFGKESSLTNSSKIIENAIINNTVFLSEDDTQPIYTISFSDAVNSIFFSLFGEQKREKVNFLFYENPSTYISFIHSLRRVFPDLEISLKKKIKPNFFLPSHKELEKEIEKKFFIKPYYSKLVEGFENEVKQYASNLTDKKVKINPQQIFKNKSQFSVKGLFLIVFFSLISFFLLSALSLCIGLLFFKSALSNLEGLRFENSKRDAYVSKVLIEMGRPSELIIDYPISVVAKAKIVEEKYETILRSANLLYFINMIAPEILGVGEGISEDELQKLIGKINFIYSEAEQIKNKTNNPILSKYINTDSSKILSILGVFPEILGFSNQKNYLILFQNNGELRPTGGFIGSIGEISFSKGRLKNVDVQDVYELDGQLKAHVEPHWIVRRYLQPHMYLRDSNFDPDFSISASYSSLLYQFESGKKADGVIGIDFEVLKQILKIVGPIRLKEYNKTLDEKNAFSFLENTIESEFFPGSSQKRDILNSLLNQIIISLENDKRKLFKIASIVPALLKEKHILLYSENKSTQTVFSANNFGGTISDLRDKNKYGIYDFLAINEANIGVNKANTKIERDVKYLINVSENKNKSKVVLTFKNNGSNNYRSYIKVMTPLGSSFENIKIDNKILATVPAITDYSIFESPNFSPPNALEIEETTKDEIKTFGFVTNINGGKSQTIELSYENGSTPLSKTYGGYSLLYIKQPGTSSYPLSVKISTPQNFHAKNNGVIFNENINSDKEIKATLISQ